MERARELSTAVRTIIVSAAVLYSNMGIIVACIPAVALALLQHGVVAALVVAVGLTAINYIGDYAITPRLMSQGLGLSQFTVFSRFSSGRMFLGRSAACCRCRSRC